MQLKYNEKVKRKESCYALKHWNFKFVCDLADNLFIMKYLNIKGHPHLLIYIKCHKKWDKLFKLRQFK